MNTDLVWKHQAVAALLAYDLVSSGGVMLVRLTLVTVLSSVLAPIITGLPELSSMQLDDLSGLPDSALPPDALRQAETLANRRLFGLSGLIK